MAISRLKTRKKKVNLLIKVKVYSWVFFILLSFTFFAIKKDSVFSKKNETSTVATEEVAQPSETLKVADAVPTSPATKSLNVDSVLGQYPNISAAVSLIDLGSGETKNFGSTNTFIAASTTKVISGICLLQKVDSGKTSLNSAYGNQTFQWYLKTMINQSNNDSWAVINGYLGYSALQSCGRSLGASSFRVNDNSVLPSDEAKVLAGLYRGDFLKESSKNLLLSYMQNTNNENLIPAALNSDTVVYHKYGNLDSNLHDTAIIKKGDKTFVLVVYTKGISGANYSSQTELIHDVTRQVLAYYN